MEALETVRNLEAALIAKRREASQQLRAQRVALGLSLRKVSQKVNLTQGALHNLETGKSWRTQTVARIARLYERLAS